MASALSACNRTLERLQPYLREAATLCARQVSTIYSSSNYLVRLHRLVSDAEINHIGHVYWMRLYYVMQMSDVDVRCERDLANEAEGGEADDELEPESRQGGIALVSTVRLVSEM